jgi:hypothetical protein
MENQNQQTPQPQYQQTVVIVGRQKSVGVAFLLAFLFGPLGLLYASVVGGIVMIIVSVLVAIVTLGFGLLITWPICIIWAIIAANNANKKMASGARININSNIGNPPTQQPPETQTVNPPPQVQQQYSQPQVQQPKADIGEAASKSINAFADWVSNNKKGLFIGAGSILGFAILIVAVKFILSIDFKEDNSSQQHTGQTHSNEPITNQNSSSKPEETKATTTINKTQPTKQTISNQIKNNPSSCDKFIGKWVFSEDGYNCTLNISKTGDVYKIVNNCSTGFKSDYSAKCEMDKNLGLSLRVKDEYGDFTYYCLNESSNTIQTVSPTAMHPIGRETYHKVR